MRVYVEDGKVLRDMQVELRKLESEGRWSRDYSSEWYWYDDGKVLSREEFQDLIDELSFKVEELEVYGDEWMCRWEERRVIDG